QPDPHRDLRTTSPETRSLTKTSHAADRRRHRGNPFVLEIPMMRIAPLFFALIACTSSSDSGSGVTSTKKLVELNTSERQQLCTYMVQAEGGEHSKMCGDGLTVTVKPASECVSGLSAF